LWDVMTRPPPRVSASPKSPEYSMDYTDSQPPVSDTWLYVDPEYLEPYTDWFFEWEMDPKDNSAQIAFILRSPVKIKLLIHCLTILALFALISSFQTHSYSHNIMM
jgi:hypothetical protein